MSSKTKAQSANSANIDALVAEVLAAPKYRQLEPGLVRQVAAQVLRSTPQHKAALKETKSRLHQSAAAYLRTAPRYSQWLAQLEAASSTEDDWRMALRPTCLQIMAQHSSTHERIPHLEGFYGALFAELGSPAHILDLGCGLNPLALPWMPLPATVRYDACDVFADMIDFVGAFLALVGNVGQAFVCDLTMNIPQQPVDLVLALKLLPVLEQLERGAALDLLEQLKAPKIIVSYPLYSLGGRSKGMAVNYERQLYAMLAGKPWGLRALDLPGELLFLIEKGAL